MCSIQFPISNFKHLWLYLMKTPTAKATDKRIVRGPTPVRGKRCLACGKPNIDARRRYCSKECREYINWVLSLSKGLLRAVNARYAAFSFTDDRVILDVFPVWSKHTCRFVHRRIKGSKPAQDLKNLVIQFGQEWHDIVNNNRSRSYASLCLVNRNHKKGIHPNSIRPAKNSSPRVSKQERGCLQILKLQTLQGQTEEEGGVRGNDLSITTGETTGWRRRRMTSNPEAPFWMCTGDFLPTRGSVDGHRSVS